MLLMLTQSEQRILLDLAVRSLQAHLQGQPVPEPSSLTPSLLEPRGAFVTWKKAKELRGCIGSLYATDPLWCTVRRMALSAGERDHRFSPVTLEELPKLHVDISALSPCSPMKDSRDIQVGVHGLWIRKNELSGVLLPQVASERGWDQEEFLRQTCRKAGLAESDWESGVEIFLFTAEVFSAAAAEISKPVG